MTIYTSNLNAFRNRLVGLAMSLAWLLLTSTASAQTVSFMFVVPSGVMQANFPAASLGAPLATGYQGVIITPANLVTFRTLASPNMLRTYDALQTGTAIRNRVNAVMQISTGKTDNVFLLVDDRTGLANNGTFTTNKINGKLAVWPSAYVTPIGGGRFRGVIRLGELASKLFETAVAGGWLAWEGTILHETLHTQFVGEKTKWGSINIVYGGNEQHEIREILGEQENPFEEGLGTFYADMHNNLAGVQESIRFFTLTGQRYFIESRSVLAGTAEIWNSPHREEEHLLSELPNPADRTGRYAWRYYKWLDVPGFYLLFSESTSTAFHDFFWKHTNNNHDQAFTMINASSNAMWQDRRKRYLTYAVNRLALQMEAFAATPDGAAAKTAGTLTSSMFPFALLDILTHFGMSDEKYKQDYQRNNPDRHPRAFTEYWAQRNAVKALVLPHLQASPIRIEQAVTEAHRYFQQANTILAANL